MTKHPLHILFISPYIPSQIRVRPYNLIKYIIKRGHRLTLLALVPPGEDTSSLALLRTWCHQVRTVPLPRWQTFFNAAYALPTQVPLQAAYSRSSHMAKLIREIQDEATFHVVHIEHLRGAELGHAVQDLPIVFDSVDSITLLFEKTLQYGPTWKSRLMAGLDLARTRHYEGTFLKKYNRTLITSPQDKDMLVKLTSNYTPQDDRFVVLPNGVDLDYFQPMDIPREPDTLIFTGKMSYHANIAAALDLAQKVMPLIWREYPEVKLVLAGKDPSPELLALNDERINVTGAVPDLRPYLAKATIAVMPIRYSVGIQNKILESMAMATPVITSPPATAALETEAGKEIIVAESNQEMAQATINLLKDTALQRIIGETGRNYVEQHHDWRVTAEQLEHLYLDVLRKP